MNIKRFVRLVIVMLLGLTLCRPVTAQIWSGRRSCSGVDTGTSFQCWDSSAVPLLGGSLVAIGLSFTADVCSTISTPTNWSKAGCGAVSGGMSAAVFYQTVGAGNTVCTALHTPDSCCTGLHTGTCDNNDPTFTWTGSATTNGYAFLDEGVVQNSQLDVASVHTGTSTRTMTATSVTTTSPVDHLIAWYFTDAGVLTGTFTPPAGMPLAITDNIHVAGVDGWHTNGYPTYVAWKRQIVPGVTGDKTGTASVSSNYVAFLLAFKNLHAPVARVEGGVGFAFADIATYLVNNGDRAFCKDCKNRGDGATVGAACAGDGTGAWAIKEGSADNCF